MPQSEPAYKRVLLKLSGEALLGDDEFGIASDVVERLAREVNALAQAGVEVAVVVGGGNIFRGIGLAGRGMDRVSGDHMGMLATIINALALQDALEQIGASVRVMSAIRINQVCEDYIRRRAVRHLEKGRIVIFAAGTGNPFFTTDSAASLRAIEINADLMLKATKVDGIYSADPLRDPQATRYSHLTYDQAIDQRLAVMDTTAIVLCRDNGMPLRVFDIKQENNLQRVVCNADDVGTLVDNQERHESEQ